MFLMERIKLQVLLRDKRIERKVNEAKTWREASAIIAEEARKHGFKIMEA